MIKRICAALIFVLAVSVVVSIASSGFPMTIVDDTGASIYLAREPQRIVSLAPSNTEILYRVGLGPKVVGVTSACDYPADARRVDKIGDYNINIEAVIAKKPDLVVAVADLQMNVVTRLRELGLPVLAVNPKGFEDVFKAMDMIGRAGGNGAYARAMTENIMARRDVVARKVNTIPSQSRPGVFVEIWNDPLMTAGAGTFVDDLIKAAGGRNIAGKIQGWPQFSLESVIVERPEFIILTCYNRAEVMARPAWRNVPAVSAGKVYELNPDILVRPGPRLIDGLETLVSIFHPTLFR